MGVAELWSSDLHTGGLGPQVIACLQERTGQQEQGPHTGVSAQTPEIMSSVSLQLYHRITFLLTWAAQDSSQLKWRHAEGLGTAARVRKMVKEDTTQI